MATITKTIAMVSDAQGNLAELQYDYDDQSLLITAVRVINNTGVGAFASATRTSDGLNYSHTFPSNGTTFINIPTQKSQQLQLTLTASGKLDGVEIQFYLLAQ